ncbi:MAG: DUF975 family protein [Coriobacteriia bacterium]|nr:DUF975 family protein [Coriobacteriia bacterium]
MFDRVAIKARAREVLKLNLGHLIAAYAIAVLLPSIFSGGINGGSSSTSNIISAQSGNGSHFNALAPFLIMLIAIFMFMAFIFSLALILYSVLGTGAFARMSLKAYDGVPVRFSDLLEIKDYWLKVLGLYLWMGLRIFLWSLLFIIPGIIAMYRYALAPYLLFEDPSKEINQVINESTTLMRGFKGQLFLFDLSFFWWWCLVAVTFGLAMIYVGPYFEVARAGAYRAIRYLSSQRAGEGAPINSADPSVVTQTVSDRAGVAATGVAAAGAAVAAAVNAADAVVEVPVEEVTEGVELIAEPVTETVVEEPVVVAEPVIEEPVEVPVAEPVVEAPVEVEVPIAVPVVEVEDVGVEPVTDYVAREEPHMSLKDTLEDAFVEPVRDLEELAEEKEVELEDEVANEGAYDSVVNVNRPHKAVDVLGEIADNFVE